MVFNFPLLDCMEFGTILGSIFDDIGGKRYKDAVLDFHWFAAEIPIAAQLVLFSQSGGLNRPISDTKPLKILFDNFKDGYETENHLDEIFLKKMDLFIDYRRMLLFTVMQDWLESKPYVKKIWKTMILDISQIMECK